MPTTTLTFRVFVSSTFEDMKEERNALQTEVFPRLQRLCEEYGARFQAIDLRWGVRQEAATDHRSMEICLTEIDRCQKTGIKPNFIVLLGERYGWRPVPARISAEEFEKVRGPLTDVWYQRDDNAVPPEYLLKPRTDDFPEAQVHRALREASRVAGLTNEAMVKYEASATHQEILKGLGNTAENRHHVFAFCRAGAGEDADVAKLKALLPDSVEYAVGDLATLCREVYAKLEPVILGEAARFQSKPALDIEVQEHDEFARERARFFVGRAGVLEAIREYVGGNDRRVLVLHGASGSGKSAVMARSSGGNGVIRRFIGATPESPNALALLRGLCQQMGVAEPGKDMQSVIRALWEQLALATAKRPIVLFIDGLDQLTECDWLPSELPLYCRIVVSTTEAIPGALSAELDEMPIEDARELLDLWLVDANRTLQDWQRARLLASFGRCGLPLYLKLAFEEARHWRSFDEGVLGDGLDGIINVLFARLSDDRNHGGVLVAHALGLLAAARSGLTEGEMIDVLSADDEVWKDFSDRAKHTPPVRRLPVIVWSRLFFDLEPYLTERASPGGIVMTWYHRQLREQIVPLHEALARYFGRQANWIPSGEWRPNLRKAFEVVYQHRSASQLEAASSTLTDLDFVSSKCAADLVFDLQDDYHQTIRELPDAQGEIEDERRRDLGIAAYIRDLIAYARRETPYVEVPESVKPGTLGRGTRQSERTQSELPWLDRLYSFAQFVEGEIYPLLKFGGRPTFTIQHAFNHDPRSPVHSAAERLVRPPSGPVLLRIWENRDSFSPNPALVRTLEGHTSTIWSVCVTPDGRRAVSASSDQTLRVWDLLVGACLQVCKVQNTIHGVSMTPDGRIAVSAVSDRTVRVWELKTGKCLHVLEGHEAGVWCVAVTPDGRRALSGGWDHTLRLWDLETGVSLKVFAGHTQVIKSVAMTPDGRWAVSASEDKTVRMWDLETGVCLRVLVGHSDEVWGVSMTLDGRRAVSGSDDKTLRVWDLRTGTCLRVLSGHTALVKSVSLTANGRHVVSGGWDSTIRVWEVDSGMCIAALEGHKHFVWSVSVTADCRQLVSGSDDKTVRIWNLEKAGNLLSTSDEKRGARCVSVTPDGELAISAAEKNSLRVWDVNTQACLHTLEGHGSNVEGVCVTPDSRLAVSASWDSTLRVWDLKTFTCFRVLEGHESHVISVSPTPDSRRAVSASYDNSLRVWDLRTGKCLHVLKGHLSYVRGVSAMPDNRRAVSASADRSLRLWDLKTGRCLRILEGHTTEVNCVSVTQDGRRAVSGSKDNALRVWDLQTGRCLHVLEGHTGEVTSVSVTPDTRSAFSTSVDKTMRVWDLNTGACFAVGCLPAPGEAVALAAPNKAVVCVSSGGMLWFRCHGITPWARPEGRQIRGVLHPFSWWKRSPTRRPSES